MSKTSDYLRSLEGGSPAPTNSSGSSSSGSNVSSYLRSLEQTPEPTITQPEVIAKPHQDQESLTFWQKYKNFADRGSQLSAEFDTGAMRSIGSTLGGLAVIGNQILNPLSKKIDKAMGVEGKDYFHQDDIGTVINKFADKLDKSVSPEEKNYMDKIAGAFGSSAPFVVGGLVAGAMEVPAMLINLGSAGTEALTNAYDDYTAIKQKGDSEGTTKLKALGSFGANLALNFITNKLGWLHEGEAKTVLGATKNFLLSGIMESGQETAQQIISNFAQNTTEIMNGDTKSIFTGGLDTFLISLPVSIPFGALGMGGNILNIREQEKIDKNLTTYVDELSNSGVTKEQVASVLKEVSSQPSTQVDAKLDEILAQNANIQARLDENQTKVEDQKAQDILNTGVTPAEASYQLSQEIGAESAIKAVQRVSSTPEFIAEQNKNATPATQTIDTTKTEQTSSVQADNTSENVSTDNVTDVQKSFETTQNEHQANIDALNKETKDLLDKTKSTKANSTAKKQAKLDLSAKRLEIQKLTRAHELNLKTMKENLNSGFAKTIKEINSNLSDKQVADIINQASDLFTNPVMVGQFEGETTKQVIKELTDNYVEENKVVEKKTNKRKKTTNEPLDTKVKKETSKKEEETAPAKKEITTAIEDQANKARELGDYSIKQDKELGFVVTQKKDGKNIIIGTFITKEKAEKYINSQKIGKPKTSDEAMTRYYDEVLKEKINNEAVVIGADDLKDYFGKDYDPANHSIYSKATFDLYAKLLKEVDNATVKFTVGGTGTGKSDFLITQESEDFNGIIYDSTAYNYEGVEKQVQMADDAGKESVFYGIIPDIAKARAYTLAREERGEHPVSDSAFVRTHVGAIETMIKLIESGVDVYVLDNRGKTIDEIKKSDYILNPLDTLKELNYNELYVKIESEKVNKANYQEIIGKGNTSESSVSQEIGVQVDPNQTFYHGTLSDIKEFTLDRVGENTEYQNAKFGIFFSDKSELSSKFTEDTRPAGNNNQVNVIGVKLDIKNPLDLTLNGIFNKKEQALTILELLNGGKEDVNVYDEEVGDTVEVPFSSFTQESALAQINDVIDLGTLADAFDALYSDISNKKIMQDAGYDGIISQFGKDEKGDVINEYVAFNPSQITLDTKNGEKYNINNGKDNNNLGGDDNGGNIPPTLEVGTDEQGGIGKEDTVRPKRGRRGINTPSDVGDGLGGTGIEINGVTIEKGKQYSNQEIESVVSSLTTNVNGEIILTDKTLINEDVLEAVNQYKVGGTTKEGTGILDEYFTSSKIVDAVSQILNIQKDVKVLEPSIGSGNFVYAIPENFRKDVTGFEINPVTAGIAKIFHNDITVNLNSFETLFVNEKGKKKEFNSDYDVVIGNPPYGNHRGLYKGLGEEPSISRYENYFIKRGLDLLKEGGKLAMVVPSGFIRGKVENNRKTILDMAIISEAWRLPNGSFSDTDIGTDIIVFEKKKGGEKAETIFDDMYFENNPDNILGEQKDRRGKFGMEQYVTGSIDDALDLFNERRTKVQATKLLEENNIEATEDNIAQAETTIEETSGKVKEEVTAEELKKATKTAKVIEKIKKDTVAKPIDYKGREVMKLSDQLPDTTPEELALWERTNRDGYVENPTEKEKEYLNYMSGNYYNDFNYAQEDIYERLDILEKEKDQVPNYQKQKDKLMAILPTPETVSTIKLPPDGNFIAKMPFGEGKDSTLKSSFKEWLDELPSEVFGASSKWDIRAYINREQVRGNDKKMNDKIRENRKVKAEELLKKYLNELNDSEKKIVEDAYNKQFNAYYRPDFTKMPIFQEVFSTFKDKDFKLRKSQKELLGMIANRGIGLGALDVGNGKTHVGILATTEAMKRGYAKRPIWVVPNGSIAQQWIDTAKELVPNIKINNLGNLGKDYKEDLSKLEIKDGEITIVTTEGLKLLEFSKETYKKMGDNFAYISDDLSANKSKRDGAKRVKTGELIAGTMKKGTRDDLSFETLGFDYLVFDEVQLANHIVSKVKMEEGESSNFKTNQVSSDLGIKTWLASQYIQSNNNGKNVLILSATPFTSNPLEYYSIISLVGQKYLEKIGATNVNDFFNMFMEASFEYEVKANGEMVKVNDIRGFKNHRQWKNLLNQFSIFASQPEDIIVPDKEHKSYYIPQNAMQIEYNARAQQIFRDIAIGGAFSAMGEMQKSAFSPYLSQYYTGKLSKADYKMFVEGSPKIKATMELIRQNLKDEQRAGQIIYTAKTGRDTAPLMQEYLIKELGLKPEQVGILNGTTPKNKRIPIQEAYNKGIIKVIIGSDTIQVGVELQMNSTDMYIIGMPWNFTALRQVTGRIWRQNNMWKNVRINMMMTENSFDVFKMQKIQNKQDRYDSAIANNEQEIDLGSGDIDAEEMKSDLMTDPHKKAQFIISQKIDLLNDKIATAKSEQAFAMRKFNKITQVEKKLKDREESLAYEKQQQEQAIKEGKEPNTYWAEKYTKEVIEDKQELADMRQEYMDKGISLDQIDIIMDKSKKEIASLEDEIKEVKDNERELTAQIKASMPVLKEFSPSDITAFVNERAQQNKTFYQLREDPKAVDVKIATKEIKNASGTKVVKTKKVVTTTPTVKVEKKTEIKKGSGKLDPITAILLDTKLSVKERVSKLLDKKQENKDFKDTGTRVAGSKKENAVIKAVMQYGDADMLNALIDELGIDVVAGTYDKEVILENTPKPDIELDKKNKVPAFIAGAKQNIFRIINNKPNLQEKKSRNYYSSSTSPIEYHDSGKNGSYYTGGAETQKLGLKLYPNAMREFVENLANAKNSKDIRVLRGQKYFMNLEGKILIEEDMVEDVPYVVINQVVFGKSLNSAFDDIYTQDSKVTSIERNLNNVTNMTPESIKENQTSDSYYYGLRKAEDISTYNHDAEKTFITLKEAVDSLANRDAVLAELNKRKAEYIDNYEKFLPKKAVKGAEVNLEHGNFTPIETYDIDEKRIPDEKVTTEHLTKNIGFKSVQYGNYMDNESALEHTRQTIGAIEDMSKIMNMDLPLLMNNRGLSMAFGARGGGKALAHYEPTANIINLTKKRGDGSFGHEFGHFLDRTNKSGYGDISAQYRSSGRYYRTEVSSYELMKMIMTGRGIKIDQTFKPEDTFDETDYMVDEVMLYRKNGKSLADMVTKYQEQDKSPDWYKALANVYREDVISKVEKGGYSSKSEYYTNSKKTGGEGYWVKKEELFARAFQTWLEDKMEEKGIVNSYVTHSTKESLVYPQGVERQAFNKKFDEVFANIAKAYPYKENNSETPRFKMGESKPLVLTKAGDYLEDVKKRLNIDFNTYLFDTIISSEGEAMGAMYDNTILLANYDQMTKAHETMHLVLANAERMPIFKKLGITRKTVLETKAKEMGLKIGKDNFIKIEEALATDFENYLAKKYTPKQSLINRFFEYLRTQFAKFKRAIIETDGNIIQDFFDILDEGVAKEEEMITFEEKGIIASLIDDTGILNFPDKNYDGAMMRMKDMKEDSRLANVSEEATKIETIHDTQIRQLADWKSYLDLEVARRINANEIIDKTGNEIKNLSRYVYKKATKDHQIGQLTPKGLEKAREIEGTDLDVQVQAYLQTKVELQDARQKTKNLRQDIKALRTQKTTTKTEVKVINRKLRARQNQVKLIKEGFAKASKQEPRIVKEATKYGKTSKTYEIRNRQKDIINKMKVLPMSSRGKLVMLRDISRTNNDTSFANINKKIDEKIHSYQKARELSKDLSKDRSIIGFLKHIGEMDNKLITDVKNQLGIEVGMKEMTKEELGLMIEELKVRLAFKQAHGVGITHSPMSEAQINAIAIAEAKKTWLQRKKEDINYTGVGSIKDIDVMLGSSSTRLFNIAPELSRKSRDWYVNVISTTTKDHTAVKDFTKNMIDLKSKNIEDFTNLDIALKNRNVEVAEKIMVKNGIDFAPVKQVLEEIHGRATETNVNLGYLVDYFPRLIKASKRDELVATQIKLANEALVLGRKLTITEEAEVANNAIIGFDFSKYLLTKAGAMKERMIDNIDAELKPFYEDSPLALAHYIETMNTNIETRKFFGKFAENADLEKNMNDTIGAYVMDLISKGKITWKQQQEVTDIFRAMFSKNRMSGFLESITNLSYMATMFNVTSAFTQVQDLSFSLVDNGFYGTAKGFAMAVSGRGITLQDLYLSDSALNEINNKGALSKAVEFVFTSAGIKLVDQVALSTYVNGRFDYYQNQAKKNTLSQTFLRKLDEVFGTETTGVIADLKAGKLSDDVKRLIIDDALDIRPQGATEKAEGYNSSGNSKVFYTLKQYTLKQMDIFRKRAYIKIKVGIQTKNNNMIYEGTSNLIKLTLGLILMGMGADQLKDWLLGRTISLKDKVMNNIIKLFGISQWTVDIAGREGLGSAVQKTVSPVQFTAPWDLANNIYTDVTNPDLSISNSKSIKNTPIVGSILYNRLGKGTETNATNKESAEKEDIFTKSLDTGLDEDEYADELTTYYESMDKELTNQAKGQLQRDYRIAQEYGTDDANVKALDKAQTIDKKVKVLMDIHNVMGDDFIDWLDNAHEVGLVSDATYDKYYEE